MTIKNNTQKKYSRIRNASILTLILAILLISISTIIFSNNLFSSNYESAINYVTPQQFGAKGDGISDDTEPMKKAIMSGKPIYLSKGKYLITKTILLTTNVYISGESQTSTTIISPNSYAFKGQYGYSSTIRNLTFKGYGVDQLSGSMLSNITFRGTQGLRNIRVSTLTSITFVNLEESGIDKLTDSKIINSNFINNKTAINLSSSNDNQIYMNRFNKNDYAITIRKASFNTINRNYFLNQKKQYIKINSADHLEIINNIIQNTQKDAVLLSGQYVKFTNNTFNNLPYPLKIHSLENSIISNNNGGDTKKFIDIKNSYQNNVIVQNNSKIKNDLSNNTFLTPTTPIETENLFKLEKHSFVSVKSFGAKGDGITDDTEAIKKALKTKKDIYFPNGNYIITETIILPQKITLFGLGSIKNWGSENTTDKGQVILTSLNQYAFKGGKNISFRNINFNGNGITKSESLSLSRTSFTGKHGILNIKSSVVSNSVFNKMNNFAIQTIHNTTIINSFIMNSRIAIKLNNSNNNFISTNKIEWNEIGIDINKSVNNKFTNNTFDRQTYYGIISNSSANIIVDNRFERNVSGHLLLTNSSDIVDGNVFYIKSIEDAGIGGMKPDISITALGNSENLTISNNLSLHNQSFINKKIIKQSNNLLNGEISNKSNINLFGREFIYNSFLSLIYNFNSE